MDWSMFLQTTVPIGALIAWGWSRIDKKFEFSDKKIDALDQKADKRMDSIDQKADKRMDSMDQKIEKRFETMEDNIEKKFQDVQNKLDKLESEMRINGERLARIEGRFEERGYWESRKTGTDNKE